MVYGLAIVEEICKCILCVSRLKSGAWVKNLTRSLAGKYRPNLSISQKSGLS